MFQTRVLCGELRGSLVFFEAIVYAGALCRESDMIEVSKNQPRIAARKGCGGQRDAGPDSRGSLIPFALSCVWTLLSRGKKMVGILFTQI